MRDITGQVQQLLAFQAGCSVMKALNCLASVTTSLQKLCCPCVQKKNQRDITECVIALMICSTCFGHFYAHHQELETICVLLPPMVCSASLLVVGGSGAGQQAVRPGRGMLHFVQHPSS